MRSVGESTFYLHRVLYRLRVLRLTLDFVANLKHQTTNRLSSQPIYKFIAEGANKLFKVLENVLREERRVKG